MRARLMVCLWLVGCHGDAGTTTVGGDGAVEGKGADAGSDVTVSDAGSGVHLMADAVPLADAGPLTLADEYARAAVVVGSCLSDDGINRSLTRFWDPLAAPQWSSQFQRQAHCLANSGGGCAAMATCLGYSLGVSGPPCTTGCQGSKLTLCGREGGLTIRMTADCAKVGLTCDPLGLCVDVPAMACADPFTAACTSDGRPTACKQAVLRGGRCADLGLSCTAGACTGTGAACPKTYPGAEAQTYLEGISCNGTYLRACAGGQEQMVDCAAQGEESGFTCQSAGGKFFCGLAADCAPDERTGGNVPVRCDGNTVVVCNAGRLDRVDCTSLGFTGCDINRDIFHYGCVPSIDLTPHP